MSRLVRIDPEIRSAKLSAAELHALRCAGGTAIERWGAVFSSFAQRPCLGVRDTSEQSHVFRALSYGELWDRVVNAATALGRGGMARPGDLVGLLGPTSVDWIVADLACLYVGAVSVPLQRTMAQEDLVHVAREAELACVVCAESDLDLALELKRRSSSIRDIVVIDCDDTAAPLQGARTLAAIEKELWAIERLAPHVPADPQSLFSIVYTSGSTGRPKGVMLTHGRWAETLADAVRGNPLPAVTVAYLPLTHMAGRISVYTTMMVGGRIHLVAEDDMPRLFDCIRATRPTTMTLVPRVSGMIHQMFLERCIKSGLEPPGSYDDARVQAIVSEIRDDLLGGRLCFAATGAAPTSPEVARFLAAVGIHVVDAYGSTEVARIAVDGAVQPGVEYKLIDVPELGYTRSDKPFPRGELAVRSPRQTPGYFKNPAANAELRDADGFLRTGDIVEERGPRRIAWIDRRSDVIRLAQGEHVNVAKLEALFAARSPCIDQVFLSGDASRDCLLAVVVPNSAMVSSRQAGATPGAAPMSVDAWLRAELDRVASLERLAGHEVPRAILIADEPFTRGNGLLSDAGKYRRPKLVERYRARLESLYRDIETNRIRAEISVAGLAECSISAQVLGAVAAVLGRDSIAPAEKRTSFVGLGGDSLGAMRLKDLLTSLLGRSVDVHALLDPSASLETLIARLGDTSAANGDRFERVHGAEPKLVRASDLGLEPFLPEQLLRNAPRLPLDAARRRVLLTGASGFLGHVLLAALLERLHGEQEIVCLVRAESDAEAHARLARKLLALPGVGASLESTTRRRVRPVAGDVAKPNLGLAADLYRELAATVTDVVHAGALVNHVLSYRQLFRSNVDGTAEIMRFAITERRKRIHFASTTGLAVGVRRAGPLPEHVWAADLWPKRRVRVDSVGDYAAGYVTSKWAAEVLLGELFRRCEVPVAVARCSMILPHREIPEVVNRQDAFARLIYGIVKTGIAPASFFADEYAGPRRYDGLPVDLVAAAMARIVTTLGEAFEIYHFCTPSSVGGASIDDLIRWVATAGYPLTWLPHGEWYPEFVRRLALLGGAEEKKYSPEAIAHRWRRPIQDTYAAIDLDTAGFRAVLAAAGAAAVPTLDEAYVHRCVPAIVGASA